MFDFLWRAEDVSPPLAGRCILQNRRRLSHVRTAAGFFRIRRLLSIADPVAPFRQAPCERRHAANGNTVGVEETPEG